MAVGLTIMAGSLALLSSVMKPETMLAASISLSILVVILASVLELVAQVGGPMAVVGAGAFAIMAAGILIICAGLSQLSEFDSKKLMDAAIAISIIVGVMTLLLGVLGAIVSTGVGALVLAAVAGIILAIAGAVLMMAGAIKIAAEGFQIFVNAVALLPTILDIFFNKLLDIITKSKDNAELAYEAGTSLLSNYIKGVTDGISKKMPVMIKSLSELRMTIDLYLSSDTYYAKGIMAGQGLMQGFAFGIVNGIEGVNSAITSAFGIIDSNIGSQINTIAENMASKKYKFQNSGVFLMQGLNNGLISPLSSIFKLMFGIGDGIIDSLNNALEIHSPSERTMETADYTADGFVNQMSERSPDIVSSGEKFGEDFLTGTNNTLGNVTLDDLFGGSKYKILQKHIEEKKSESETTSKTEKKSITKSISDAVSGVVSGLTGSSSSKEKSNSDIYNENYKKQNVDAQKLLDKLGDRINSSIEDLSSGKMGRNVYKVYGKAFENYKLYGEAIKKAYSDRSKAGPNRKAGYDLAIESYNKKQDEILKDASKLIGISPSDLLWFWNTAGTAWAYEITANSGNSWLDATSILNKVVGNQEDWSKWFTDNDGTSKDTNKNVKSIMDSLNQTNKILGSGLASEKSYTFVQNNYSPKALSTVEIYRQTNNQLSRLGRKGW